MSRSKLRKLLELTAGFDEVLFTIPHPFLPPRFAALAKKRNMLLILGDDMIMRIRWEGSRVGEYHPLSPAAAGQLLREVQEVMTKYRREVKVFETFVRQSAEMPMEEGMRPMDPVYRDYRSTTGAPRKKKEKEGVEIVAELSTDKLPKQPVSEPSILSVIRANLFGGV